MYFNTYGLQIEKIELSKYNNDIIHNFNENDLTNSKKKMVYNGFILFDEQWKTRIDLYKMQSAHKKQLISYDQYFNEHASSSDRIHIDQYIRYLTNLFKHKSLKIDANMIRRYAVKTSIEYESEFKYREENLFNWQVDTYEDINTYYSSI
jgi:hypothetical protein